MEADEYGLKNAKVIGQSIAPFGPQHIMSIDATAKKDWGHEADMWEVVVKHIYVISDALADGIAKQFPDKFQ